MFVLSKKCGKCVCYKLWADAVFSRWPQALFFLVFALFSLGPLILGVFANFIFPSRGFLKILEKTKISQKSAPGQTSERKKSTAPLVRKPVNPARIAASGAANRVTIRIVPAAPQIPETEAAYLNFSNTFPLFFGNLGNPFLGRLQRFV